MMANSPKSTYFSFPSYESHFITEVEEAPTPATATLSQKALEPMIDCSAEAYPIIQRDSHLEAEIELILYLNAPKKPASLFSESSSSNNGSPELSRHSPDHLNGARSRYLQKITAYSFSLPTPYLRLSEFKG
ncbi:hypothetical protein PGT21_010101 [Puccinia graminis f. sp. tritici]|uniref:Uncharacterized protein n=1 Tax=Puccinia graminis f. sp. tritici TaxID=56615 RepID=A0A5B0MQT6_PUCGR|nr:hypothetical protein PGT21_010101 [Puccinia graminis f. sp. tritici]